MCEDEMTKNDFYQLHFWKQRKLKLYNENIRACAEKEHLCKKPG